MNKALLIGRLTRDPELRATSTGRNVCQFSIAVNRNFTNANGEREADFINCVVWDKQAENLVKYQKKGNQIAVDGRIQTRNYEDKDGKRVKEVVDGKKVTVYDEVEKKIKKDQPSRLHARREMLKVLYTVKTNDGSKKGAKEVDLVAKLFDEIAPKYAGRQGGYTRIVKIGLRKGDAAMEVLLELV